LWRHPQFLKLWTGQTISVIGDQASILALPLTAVLLLSASPLQMGVLGATQSVPWLLVGLPAGAWVDRLPRRPVLIASDLGRAALLVSLPITAMFGWLSIEQLYIVGFLTGVLDVFFGVAYQAFLPGLIQRRDLVEGNTKLEFSASIAQAGGPGLAGALVQHFGAPHDARTGCGFVSRLGRLDTAHQAAPDVYGTGRAARDLERDRRRTLCAAT
jgi:MFS family permease